MHMKIRAHNFIDLTGKKFNRLTVLHESSPGPDGKPRWRCKCDCGNFVAVAGSQLRRGQSKSCGCLMIERTKQANTRHGMKGTRVYRIWSGMLDRCRNQSNKDYPRYGGAGIRVCDRWHSFESFYEDMGYPPDGASIDRRDGTKGYCPENCRWANAFEQARNRKTNVFLELNGQRKTASEWAMLAGVSACIIYRRHLRGWSDEKVLTTPPVNLTIERSNNSHEG